VQRDIDLIAASSEMLVEAVGHDLPQHVV